MQIFACQIKANRQMQKREGTEKENGGFLLVWKTKILKGEFHSSAHACILTGLCTLSGTGPGFSLFMNQSWASYLILHANSPKIINRRINLSGQQLNSTVHCVGKICWNPLRILVIRLLPRLTIGSDYWTTSQCGFWSDKIDYKLTKILI